MRNFLVFGCIVTAVITVVVVALLRHSADYYYFNRFESPKGLTTTDCIDQYYNRKAQAKDAACIGGGLFALQAFIIMATAP
jgi:hypothetical protein